MASLRSTILFCCMLFCAFGYQDRIVKDSEDTIVQLQAHTEKRLTFRLPASNFPLWLWLTPCGSSVHWRLSHKRKNDIDLPIKTNLKLDTFNFLGHVPVSVNWIDTTNHLNTIAEEPEETVFASGTDRHKVKFYKYAIPAGEVTLSLMAENKTTIRVLMTSSIATLDQIYPRIPKNGGQITVQVEEDISSKRGFQTAVVSWNKSESEKYFAMSVQYCLTVTKTSLNSLCELESSEMATESNRIGDRRTAECVYGNSTSHTLRHLLPNTTYIVTVFAVNTANGASERYLPQNVTTRQTTKTTTSKTAKRKKTKLETAMRLYDGKLQAGQLLARNKATHDYTFFVHKRTKHQKVLLIVHVCLGYVRVAISRDGRLLRRSDAFTGFRRFLVLDAEAGPLLITLINADHKPTVFKIWASTRPHKNPYASLPLDTSIQETERTCDGVRLQWLRADGHNRYCLYQRPENSNYLTELVRHQMDYCDGPPMDTTLVGCYDDEQVDHLQAIMHTLVDGLVADVTYRFDLYVQPLRRTPGQQLSYRTLWVHTRQHCR